MFQPLLRLFLFIYFFSSRNLEISDDPPSTATRASASGVSWAAGLVSKGQGGWRGCGGGGAGLQRLARNNK